MNSSGGWILNRHVCLPSICTVWKYENICQRIVRPKSYWYSVKQFVCNRIEITTSVQDVLLSPFIATISTRRDGCDFQTLKTVVAACMVDCRTPVTMNYNLIHVWSMDRRAQSLSNMNSFMFRCSSKLVLQNFNEAMLWATPLVVTQNLASALSECLPEQHNQYHVCTRKESTSEGWKNKPLLQGSDIFDHILPWYDSEYNDWDIKTLTLLLWNTVKENC